jgi:hypothetical protein
MYFTQNKTKKDPSTPLEALKITPCSDSFIVAIVARETVLQ